MERYTVDRLEDQHWAVIEDAQSQRLRIPKAWLPASVAEGDVLNVSDQPSESDVRLLRFAIDAAAKEKALGEVRQLRDGIKKGPKGDVVL